MKKVLTIAGSDCSGGAGIQADLKTIAAHKIFGMSVVTALTAQNTTGVFDVLEVPPQFVSKQIACVFEDIVPDAVKIGMVSTKGVIEAIVSGLKRYQASVIVIDPVMVSTSGSRLLAEDALEFLKKELLPIGTVITPNIPEAELLCEFSIKTEEDMMHAAEKIGSEYPGAVLIKGGHFAECANDYLYQNGAGQWLRESYIKNSNTHGTGCTLSSAIACGLASGLDVPASVKKAKNYLTQALGQMLDLGRGRGPLDHTVSFFKEEEKKEGK